jgi:acetylornithine deacetylase/succinyl-diaminopimelate desuccinylase-like protein
LSFTLDPEIAEDGVPQGDRRTADGPVPSAGSNLCPRRDYQGWVPGLFHAVDERVPLSALRFGARVTERILRTA